MPNLREPVSLTIFSLPVKLIKWLVWYEHSSNNHMLYILLLHILPYFCHNRFQRVFYMTRVLVSFTGVGKSSLVHLLCQNQVLGNPSWTVGCSVDVRVCVSYILVFQCLVKDNFFRSSHCGSTG